MGVVSATGQIPLLSPSVQESKRNWPVAETAPTYSPHNMANSYSDGDKRGNWPVAEAAPTFHSITPLKDQKV